jgi:Uma2 family endonuclease
MVEQMNGPVSDDELIEISDENPTMLVERESDGTVVMSPVGALTARWNGELGVILTRWNDEHGLGLVFAYPASFNMWKQAVLSPAASWISNARWDAREERDDETFAAIVPDVCIEVVSAPDNESATKRRAQRYLDHGARFVVSVDPFRRSVWSDGTPPPHFPTDFGAVFAIE